MEQIKFILILSIPFVLLATLIAVLIFSKRIPSPAFLYTFLSTLSNALSKRLFGQVIIKKNKLLQDIANKLGLTNVNDILLACKLIPHIRFMKNGKKIRRTIFIITKENIYFLFYIYGRKLVEMDTFQLDHILLVETKTKDTLFNRYPVISIKTSDDGVISLLFPPVKISKKNILIILDTLKKAREDITVNFNLPESFRYDTEIWKELNKDIKDIFK